MTEITLTHSSDVGQRLDRFCKKYLPQAALGGIYKMLRTGKIKVNGKKKPPTYILQEEDRIAFWMTDEELGELRSLKIEKQNIKKKRVDPDFTVLYEDEYIMIVDKPAGLSVHAGDHKTKESNLIDQVQDFLMGKYDSLTFRPALVHRIDRETSGCVIIAKEKQALELLLQDLQNHKIEKIYHAMTLGSFPQKQGTIKKKLLRIENAKHEAKVRVDDYGQRAITHYRVLQSVALSLPDQIDGANIGEISLVECRIETGRTHQIRVHLASLGCPILGDRAYGNAKINAFVRRHAHIDRQLLHAKRLIFSHPITKKRLEIEAPDPQDLLLFTSKSFK